MIRKRCLPLLSLLALTAISACSGDDPPPDEVGRTGQLPDTAVVELRAPPDTAWLVRPTGAGPVRIGMTVGEASEALGGALDLSGDTLSCYYADPFTAPDSLSFMVVDGRIVRLDVWGGSIETAQGIRVGDSEDQVRSTYPGHWRMEPHKYTDGHYLIVNPLNAPDTAHLIIFETDGQRVTQYRAGVLEPVRWVEGCS